MDNVIVFLFVFIGSVFISSISQVMLKKSANKKYADLKSEYLNPMVIGAYALFLGSTLVTVFAYRFVPLSMGPVLESLGYVFIGVLGYFILKEKLNMKSIAGMVLIVLGVVICSI